MVALLVAVAFFGSAGVMIGQSSIDALFFARFGIDRLPVMYILLGFFMFAASLGIGAIVGRVGRARLFTFMPLVIAAVLVVNRIALVTGVRWLYAALWLVYAVAQYLEIFFVWGLAGIVTDTRQGKRLFPLVGAGGVLGLVVGGLVTGPLAPWLGAENLIFVWAATLAAVFALAALLVGRSALQSRPRSGRRAARSVEPRTLEEMTQGYRFVRRSRLMRWMSAGAAAISFLFFSLYLPFARAAIAEFPDVDELAGFFGVFFGISMAVALVASLFVTNRLFARFGVPTVGLVLPLIYLSGFGVAAVQSSFGALAIFRFVQVVWTQAVAVSAWEATINVVPPQRRDQTRAFLYGGPTQVGTVMAGVIALGGDRALSSSQLYVVGFGAAALAAFVMWKIRGAYAEALLEALREGRPHVFPTHEEGDEPFAGMPADATALSVVVAATSDPDPKVRLVAVEVLGEVRVAEAVPPLRAALRDEEPAIRAAALTALATAGAVAALLDVSDSLEDEAAEVRLAAVNAVSSLAGPTNAVATRLRPLLDDGDVRVRGAAASALLAGTPDPGAAATLRELAGSSQPEHRAIGLRALPSSRSPESFDLALRGLRDEVPGVREAAAYAIAGIDPMGAVDPLVEALSDQEPAVRAAAAEGLGAVGKRATEAVVRALSSPTHEGGALLALGRLPIPGDGEAIRRYARDVAVRALEDHHLALAVPGGTDHLLLLRDALEARSKHQALNALRALAILGARRSLLEAVGNLETADAAQRANALEMIDTMGERTIVRPLLRIWEPSSIAGDRVDDWLARARNHTDEWIRDCADLAAISLDEGGTMTETLATLPVMERVLFLRKVSLFSELAHEDLRRIAEVAEEHAFVDGETMAVQGDVGDEMLILVSGELAVVVRDGEGPERMVARRGSGDVVGEMAIISNRTRMASLVARTDVRALRIARKQFEAILRERPAIAMAVMRVLCDRIAERESQAGAPAV
jgi:HEAT repeat protein